MSWNNVPSGATCVPVHCSSKQLTLLKYSFVGLVQSGHHLLIERKLFFPRYRWNKSHLVLNNHCSFTNVFETFQWKIVKTEPRYIGITEMFEGFFICVLLLFIMLYFSDFHSSGFNPQWWDICRWNSHVVQ